MMHTKNLLEIVRTGYPDMFYEPDYIIAKKEIEEAAVEDREFNPDAFGVRLKSMLDDIETFEPQTCPEAYLIEKIEEMKDES